MTKTLLISLVTVAVVAGCGTPGPGGASDTATPATSQSASGAPALPQPEIDVTKFLANPCTMITSKQAADVIGGATGTPWTESTLGPACRWRLPSDPAKLTFLLTLDKTSGGIAELFRRPKNYQVFEPTTAGGQPGVIALPEDLRQQGDCSLEIGLAKDVLLRVSIRLGSIGNTPEERSNPCPRAVGIAEKAITTMKAGG
ncbi:hypothetical protein JOF53_006222 [Crossiella equi]|uniref:DUF3558 domain-containing protein n=2 Tax=Crossiella equi TaxID=130796 RepID=A0ABS5AL99_9PSEU|nr:DUF3558 domain-containing protein [Crossiella equi]MBP2477350.1 hypothetical protein [Crossiella equi]